MTRAGASSWMHEYVFHLDTQYRVYVLPYEFTHVQSLCTMCITLQYYILSSQHSVIAVEFKCVSHFVHVLKATVCGKIILSDMSISPRYPCSSDIHVTVRYLESNDSPKK